MQGLACLASVFMMRLAAEGGNRQFRMCLGFRVYECSFTIQNEARFLLASAC